jgi:hypothetical protein
LNDFSGVTLGLFGCRGCSRVGAVGIAMESVLGLCCAIDEYTSGSDPPRFIRDDFTTKASGWLDDGSSCICVGSPADKGAV